LRRLAAALGPAYVRVSGTWANAVYLHDSPGQAPSSGPAGFNGVLTGQQWANVVEFAGAVDAELVTSFATGSGTRDEKGMWTPDQARRFLACTESAGGKIAAAEFMNEPTYAAMGGAPKGYDAVAYGRDIAVFQRFLKQAAPSTIFLGPGSVGEQGRFALPARMLHSEDLLAAAGPVFDAFSYHFYGAVSQRCAAVVPDAATTAEAALSEEWRPDRSDSSVLRRPAGPLCARHAAMGDRDADAACGGNPWASTFPTLSGISASSGGWPDGYPSDRPQHPRIERLRVAGRADADTPAELLGRAAMAQAHGHDRPRPWSHVSAGHARVRALAARSS
jgi:heparanase